MAAARCNVQSETPPFLERSVYYDQLSEESVKKLATLSEQKAMQMLKTLNAAARKMQKHDKRKKNADQRMNFGVYFYKDDD